MSLYDSVAFAEAEPTISMVISPPSDKILSILGINDFFIKSKLPSTTSVKKFGTDDPENSSEPILTFCGACCKYVGLFATYWLYQVSYGWLATIACEEPHSGQLLSK